MAMGENGLVAKSEQAKKEQAKAELYDTVKSSYAALSLRAIRNDKDKPNVEEVFNTADFTDRYNIVGDNITDKKGTVIDTKANVLNVIQGTVAGGFSSGTSTGGSGESEISMKGEYVEKPWPKRVAGVTIPEEDKDKMILKLKVKKNIQVEFGEGDPYLRTANPIEIDYGTGEKGQINDLFTGVRKEYNPGEYIIKIKNVSDFSIRANQYCEIEILQWGKILEKNENNYIRIPNVSKVYEPEPDKIPIRYVESEFTEIPEWLFSKKVTSTIMSEFYMNDKLTTIPENLFKYNVKAISMAYVFQNCTGLISIPENLFKYNVDAMQFLGAFEGCEGLTSIPEGLFKYNVKLTSFAAVFEGCRGLTSIPENLFKNNVNAIAFGGTFDGCTGLATIPENLFKHNVNVRNFGLTFKGCTGLATIPENLFKHNVNVTNFVETFKGCTGLTSIPEKIIELGKKAKEKGGNVSFLFRGCTSASNYNSLPEYMK